MFQEVPCCKQAVPGHNLFLLLREGVLLTPVLYFILVFLFEWNLMQIQQKPNPSLQRKR